MRQCGFDFALTRLSGLFFHSIRRKPTSMFHIVGYDSSKRPRAGGVVACCASARDQVPVDYSGSDVGWLVVTLRTTSDSRLASIATDIRGKDAARQANVFYTGGAARQYRTPRDFDTKEEHGAVFVRPLSAGDYELHNLRAAGSVGTIGVVVRSKTDFSIPFSIQAGKASYVGSFKAHPTGSARIKGGLADLFAGAIFAGAFFVVSDDSEQDIPSAKSKLPGLETIEHAVPTVDRICLEFSSPPLLSGTETAYS
jgi:hypothetical protein